MGRAQLRKIEQIIGREAARRGRPTHARSRTSPGSRRRSSGRGRRTSTGCTAIVVEDEFGLTRDELAAASRSAGVETRTFFCPMNLQPFLRDAARVPGRAVPRRRGALAAWLLSALVAVADRRGDRDGRRRARRAGRRPLVNSYTGLHARVYDEIYADKPYADEARFVHDLAGAPGGKLLDVACGTGRHALAFADLGYDVTASTSTTELLAVGRASSGRPRAVRPGRHARPRTSTAGRSTSSPACSTRSAMRWTNEGIVAALRSLGRHAAPAERVVCEFLHAPALVCGAVARARAALRPPRRPELAHVGDDARRRADADARPLRAAGRRHGGQASSGEEEQTNRVFTVPEMRLLADARGLGSDAIVPAYAKGEIDETTFHCSLVAACAVRVAVIVTEVGRGIGGRFTFQEMLARRRSSGCATRRRTSSSTIRAGYNRLRRGTAVWRAGG